MAVLTWWYDFESATSVDTKSPLLAAARLLLRGGPPKLPMPMLVWDEEDWIEQAVVTLIAVDDNPFS